MPLTSKGTEIMSNMAKEYGAKKGKQVFYASKNKGTIKGVDPQSAGTHFNMATNTFRKGKRKSKKAAAKKAAMKMPWNAGQDMTANDNNQG
jgi:hypothetical protein